jgi:hypothetical protein
MNPDVRVNKNNRQSAVLENAVLENAEEGQRYSLQRWINNCNEGFMI